jgi:hypothetical protein
MLRLPKGCCERCVENTLQELTEHAEVFFVESPQLSRIGEAALPCFSIAYTGVSESQAKVTAASQR